MTDRLRDRDVALLPEGVYERALAVGRRAAGRSGPNPPVGCVIVAGDTIVGEGSTGVVGSAHAEVAALRDAGDAARGATAVVTLEPCAHQGRTPPCVDALVDAGIAEVHVLHADPDPVAAGGSVRLRGAGLRVVDVAEHAPALAAAAAHDLRGFLSRVRDGRPHLTLKLAQDPDGRMTPPPGGYLTGERARQRVHALRAESDAVLVGSGTVRADDPRLDVRLVTAERQPRPVVLATEGVLPSTLRLARTGALVLVGDRAPTSRRAALVAAGLEVRTAPVDGERLDLAAALRLLLDDRILTVLAEPGATLAGALLRAGLTDVVELHVAGGGAHGLRRAALPALDPLVVHSRTPDDPRVARQVTDDGDLILRVASGVLSEDPTLAGVA